MTKPKLFLHILFVAVVLLLSFSSTLFPAITLGATSSPKHIALTWTDDPRTTQTITWQTESTVVGGQVKFAEERYAAAFPAISGTVAADVNGFSTNLGEVAIHSATLTGLKPGTRYIYRVGSSVGWSEPRVFTTAPVGTPNFKFLVFGDSQSINYDVWRTTLHQAYNLNSDAAFFSNVGDLVDVGQDYAQWNSWFNAAKGVVDNIPVMPVAGNHETYSPGRNFSMPVYFSAQLKLPRNGPEGLKGQVYSFDYGDVHFIMLDSQAGEQEKFVPDLLLRQKEWLEKDLVATKKIWKIAFIHRPLYNNKPNESTGLIRSAFENVFDKFHVDLVFTGHDHVYTRSYPLMAGAAVESTKKGTIYVASGRSGTKSYRHVTANPTNSFFYNPSDSPNYIVVEVKGAVLTIRAYKQSGEIIDEWSIEKPDLIRKAG